MDNFRVEIATNQHLGGGPDEYHIFRGDVPINIDHSLREYQPNEVREYDREKLPPSESS